MDAQFLERPFESLSAQQQQFLSRLFSRGARVFRATPELKYARWFEELERWKYVAPHETYGSGSVSYEIVESAWQELERVSVEAGLPPP